MPLREYHCERCGNFEELHKHVDDRLTSCPKCGSSVKLLLSSSNFKLVGEGFYSVDYGKKHEKKKE